MIDANGFDRNFYLARNPDVAAAGLDPYRHYLQYGWREGRDPNEIFDASYYLAVNRDVAALGLDPLDHYLRYGWREGRDPSIAFDTSSYHDANRDVAAANLNPMLHYLQYGRFEGRALTSDSTEQLREGFDRVYYLKTNTDVAAVGMDPYLHYQAYGNAEGRQPNALFDKGFYLARNPDVAAAKMDAFQHFLEYGWREGRDPSAVFNLSEYRTAAGTPADQNALLRYLTQDRYDGLPFELRGSNPPRVIQARGGQLNAVFAGQASFVIDEALIHVTAASPLDGRDLSGFDTFDFNRSTADISIAGTGRLPTFITLGTGDDRISGVFDLTGRLPNLSAGAGTLTIDAQFDNGSIGISGGDAGSNVLIRGSAAILFAGRGNADDISLGAGNDSLLGGGGVNRLNGGAGIDTAEWRTLVHADLLARRAISPDGLFDDTLISIENLRDSPFNDILLGDDGANRITGTLGNNIFAGRGGNDTLDGGNNDDILLGGSGADILSGGAGNDLLIDGMDPWGADARYPKAFSGEGDDRLVLLLGARGDENRGYFMSGGSGADTFIFDPLRGYWGSVGLEFSQIDGDRIDLSALRTASGGIVTLDYVRQNATTPFSTSTTIALSAFHDAAGNALEGHIVVNSVFRPADLREADFIFSGGADWRAFVPIDLLPLV